MHQALMSIIKALASALAELNQCFNELVNLRLCLLMQVQHQGTSCWEHSSCWRIMQVYAESSWIRVKIVDCCGIAS
jgi:hypothetical protein